MTKSHFVAATNLQYKYFTICKTQHYLPKVRTISQS